MASTLQASFMRRPACNFLVWILTFGIISISLYSYRVLHNYEVRLKEMGNLRERLRESLIQKTNYERRSQQCVLRVQEMEELRKAADSGSEDEKMLHKRCSIELSELKQRLEAKEDSSVSLLKKISDIIKVPATDNHDLVKNVKDIYDIFVHSGMVLAQLRNETKLLQEGFHRVSLNLERCQNSSKIEHHKIQHLIIPSSSAARHHGTTTPFIKTKLSLLNKLSSSINSSLTADTPTNGTVLQKKLHKFIIPIPKLNSTQGTHGINKHLEKPTNFTTLETLSEELDSDKNKTLKASPFVSIINNTIFKPTPELTTVDHDEDEIVPLTRMTIIEDSENDSMTI